MHDAINVPPSTEPNAAAETHAHGDTTTFLGRTFPVPLYTFIFIVLAVITLVEVVISELPEGVLGTLLLVGLSLVKAVLVVMFYMHLREDNRFFALALIVPLFMGILATLFLLAVPATGYGYQ